MSMRRAIRRQKTMFSCLIIKTVNCITEYRKNAKFQKKLAEKRKDTHLFSNY